MDKQKIARINELSRKQRSVGLTESESEEQKKLRDEYRAEMRGSIEQKIDNIYYKMPDGTIVKAVKEQKKEEGKQ